jgi:hypothetical protein
MKKAAAGFQSGLAKANASTRTLTQGLPLIDRRALRMAEGEEGVGRMASHEADYEHRRPNGQAFILDITQWANHGLAFFLFIQHR